MKKGTATKSSTPSRTVRASGSAERIDVNKNTSAGIRQIENGFIISESGTTGKGKNQTWFNREYFSPTNPVASAKIANVKFGGKSK